MEIEELQSELVRLRARNGEADRIRARIDEATRDKKSLRGHYRRLADQYAKEHQDVERLERLSLASFYHWLMNDKAEALERERDEMLEAKIRMDEALAAVRDAEANENELHQELADYDGTEGEVARLETKLEVLLTSGNSQDGQELREIGVREIELTDLLRELEEAYAAGKTATRHLDEVLEHLKSARNWGTFDMLGGGLLSTYVKHEKVRKAQHGMTIARRAMKRLDRELRDVQKHIESDLDLSGITSFADYFFDGILIDWFVQSKIQKGKDAVEQAERKVRHVMSTLAHDIAALHKELTRLSARRSELLRR